MRGVSNGGFTGRRTIYDLIAGGDGRCHSGRGYTGAAAGADEVVGDRGALRVEDVLLELLRRRAVLHACQLQLVRLLACVLEVDLDGSTVDRGWEVELELIGARLTGVDGYRHRLVVIARARLEPDHQQQTRRNDRAGARCPCCSH